MGIILKKSKVSFDELIGSSSFDEIFKNSIRDYYTYGFKAYDQYNNGSKSVRDRWKIFSKTLGEKWFFEKGKNGRNRIVLKSMPAGTENPVDEFYFLHNIGKIGDYLNYLIDLDERAAFNGSVEQLPVSEKELYSVEGKDGTRNLEDTNVVEYAIITNWLYEIQDALDEKKPYDANEFYPVRINRQLNIWSGSTRFMPKSYRDKYDNLSNRTEYLYALGVIGDLRDELKQRNSWLEKQWKTWIGRDLDGDNSVNTRYFNSDTSGNHFWYKSPLTMDLICKNHTDPKDTDQFINQFSAMCEFFSQYYPLGEVGTILSERCKRKIKKKPEKIFSFKHNYIQKVLYDYNLMDILVAIENRYLCLLQYSHGTNLKSSEELVIPLEMRISVTNGREYVLYYHILERRIRALRLEFIDKITMYSHVSSMTKVQRIMKKKKKVQEDALLEIDIDEADLMKQVQLADEMLPYIWGTDVGECIVDDQWRERLISFEMPISFQMETEKYIENRIKKENRSDQHGGNITIFKTRELRSWIRSYYQRIDKPEQISDAILNISDDVGAMWNVYFNKGNLPDSGEKEYKKNTEDSYIEYGYLMKGDVVSPLEGHGALFNELFSWYSMILANAVLGMADSDDLKENLSRNLKSLIGYFTDDEVQEAISELQAYAEASELVDRSGKVRFRTPALDYLYDFLPITKVEVRWLLTILEDPLAPIFLSSEEIQAIKDTLNIAPFQIKKFKIDSINYFDRYRLENRSISGRKHIAQEGRVSDKDLVNIHIIYEAIKHEYKVHIFFKNWEGMELDVICAPARIEYSRRDDTFRIWYVEEFESQIRIINVPRIMDVQELPDEDFNLEEQRKILDELVEETVTNVKIEYYQGDRNLPDRILTEFSVWKKKCVYDVSSGKYTMTLYYSKLDEKEILIRLLSYGPYIRIIASNDNYILSEIKERIKKQRQIIQDREFELG